jgi:hypothetical protein
VVKKLSQLNEIINNDEDSAIEDEEYTKRSKTPKNEENNLKLCPDFSNYLYFLFAPTLVYKDNYPRCDES